MVNNETILPDEVMFAVREHHVAGILMFVIGIIGVTGNVLVATLTAKIPSLQNAFGRLTRNQAIGDSIHLTVFTFFAAPTVFFGIDAFKNPTVSRYFGHINLICYDICTYSHLIIAINRMTAIFFPFKYNQIFSETHTKILVVMIWIVAIVPTLYYYVFIDCRFIYTDDHWNFDFKIGEPKCLFVVWYLDFMKYVSMVILIATLDIATFAKVKISTAKISGLNRDDAAARKKRHYEINFVKQVCLQGVVFIVELITYFILVDYFNDRWTKFFLTTIAWELVHTLDGVIILSFNKGFARLIGAKIRGSVLHHHTLEGSSQASNHGKGHTTAHTAHGTGTHGHASSQIH